MLTSNIEPLSEQEEFIDPDSDLMKTFTLLENEFPQSAGSGQQAKVRLAWGGANLNKDKVGTWNTTYKGDVEFDPNFSLNFHLPENQVYMRETCDDLKKVEGITQQEDGEKRDITVKCWTDYFIKEYLADLPANKAKMA